MIQTLSSLKLNDTSADLFVIISIFKNSNRNTFVKNLILIKSKENRNTFVLEINFVFTNILKMRKTCKVVLSK